MKGTYSLSFSSRSVESVTYLLYPAFVLPLFTILLLFCSSTQASAQEDIEVLLLEASKAMEAQDYASALDSLQHAQHLSHRDEGVLNLNQRPIVRLMAMTHLYLGNLTTANQLMEFRHHIVEQAYGQNTDIMAPAWSELGRWYQLTLQPERSQLAFNRALATQALFGQELVDVKLAMLRNEYFLAHCCDMSAFAGNLSDPELSHEQLLNLGDLATLADNEGLAGSIYTHTSMTAPASLIGYSRIDRMVRAYLNTVNPGQSLLDRPISSAEMSPTRLVGSPLPLCESRIADLSDHDSYRSYRIDLTLGINARGKVSNVKIANTTAPDNVVKLITKLTKHARFRPALDNGRPVASEITFTQAFDDLTASSDNNTATRLGCMAVARAVAEEQILADVM